MHQRAKVCKFSTSISSQTLIGPFFLPLRKGKRKKILHSKGECSSCGVLNPLLASQVYTCQWKTHLIQVICVLWLPHALLAP